MKGGKIIFYKTVCTKNAALIKSFTITSRSASSSGHSLKLFYTRS